MAKIFLDAGDTFTICEKNNTVFGGNGLEIVKVATGVTNLTLNANVERIQFTGSNADYKFKQVGTNLQIYSSADALIATLGVQDDTDGTVLDFLDGVINVNFAMSKTGLGLTVGGQLVSASTPTAVTILPTQITPSQSSNSTLPVITFPSVSSDKNFEAKAPFVYQTNDVNQLDSVTTLLSYTPIVTNGVDYSTFEPQQWRTRASDSKLAIDLTQTDKTTNSVIFQGKLDAFDAAQTWYKIHLTQAGTLQVQDLSKDSSIINVAIFDSNVKGMTYWNSRYDESLQLNSYKSIPAGDYYLGVYKNTALSNDNRLNQSLDFKVLINTEPSDDFITPTLQFDVVNATIHAELSAQQKYSYYKFTVDKTTAFTLDTTTFDSQFDFQFYQPTSSGDLNWVSYLRFNSTPKQHIYELSAGTYYLSVATTTPSTQLKTFDIPVISKSAISFNTTFNSTAPNILNADIGTPKPAHAYDSEGNLILTYSSDLNKIQNPENATPNPTVFSEVQKTAARLAFQEYANIAKLKFVEIPTGSSEKADITFTNVSNLGTAAADTQPHLSAMNDFESALVRVDLSDTSNATLNVGSWGYVTLLHEIGHALGLKHPGQYVNGGEPTVPYLVAAKDNEQYSIMSYNHHPYKNADGNAFYSYSGATFEKTPLLYDIAAMQSLYGANATYNAGNTVYHWDTNIDPYMTIWDGGGVDTIDASNQSQEQTIDLRAGQFSSVGAVAIQYTDGSKTFFPAKDNLSVAYDAIIENAIGGFSNDTLIGNSVANQLTGNAGKDNFVFAAQLSNFNVDTITDFNPLEDKLTLSRSIFNTLNIGNQLNADELLVGNNVTTAENSVQRIIFNELNQSLFYDSDGVGGVEPIQFATLTNVTQLNAGLIFIQA